MDGMRLEHVSEFKYFGSIFGKSGTNECRRKVVSEYRFAGAIRFLVNARGLQFGCAMVLYETLLIPVLMYGNETMIWKEKERSWIRAVQMSNLRGLPGIKSRMG